MYQSSSEKPRTRLDFLIEPIIYGDIFDYPLTLDEINKFCTLPLSRKKLKAEIDKNEKFRKIVSHKNGFYFLTGRDELVDLRRTRKEQSKKAWRMAHRVVRCIKYIPFIKGILVTGSLAVNNVRRKDDIDFLVIVKEKRIWFVFLILGVLQRIFSKRFLCPNFYKSLAHPSLTYKSFFVAREASQACPIYGEAPCQRFMEANVWIHNLFPNLKKCASTTDNHSPVERRGLMKAATGIVEWIFGGVLGDLFEKGIIRLLKHRLFVHYNKNGQTVPDNIWQNAMNEVELRFHGLNHENMVYSKMDKRKSRLSTGLKP